MDFNTRSAALNYVTLFQSTQIKHIDITQQQGDSSLLDTTESSIPTSTEDQLSTIR